MESDSLKDKRERGKLVPPPRYDHPKSGLEFWERVLPTSLKALLVLILLEGIIFLLSLIRSWTLSTQMPWLGVGIAVLTFLFIAFWVVRTHWALVHRLIHANPGTDLVAIDQLGNFWLALSTSDPDKFDIGQIQILDTKKRRFFQRTDLPWPLKYLSFDCGDIELPGKRPPLRNVQFIPELLAIQEYRKSLKSQSIRNEESQIDIQDAMLREQERHTEQNNELLREMHLLTGMFGELLYIFRTARDDAARHATFQEDTLNTGPIEAVVVEEDSPEKD